MLDEPVTKEFVRAEIAALRGEIIDMRGGLRGEIAEVNHDLTSLEARLNDKLRQQTMWMVGTLITGLGVVSGLAAR